MWNEAYKEHQVQSPSCPGDLGLDHDAEKQRGLCWIERLKCNSCAYRSKFHQLYEGVRTGRRGPLTAAPNCAAQAALTQTSIGNSSLRKIMLASNIPAPSTTSMQRTGRYVHRNIEEANIEDMAERLQQAKEISNMRATSPSNAISIESDGIFNNPLYSGVGKTPMQPATQACYIVAENVTNRRQIVALSTKNKLCSRGARSHKPCPDHSGPCTSTLAMEKNIGNEEEMAKECMEGLLEQGVEVHELTTDADSSAYRAADTMFRSGKSKTKPIHFLDTRHVSDNQRKMVKNTVFSPGFFPGKTKKQNDSLQNRFANDLAKRCEGEFQASMKHFAGDIRCVKRAMSYCVYSIVQCYQGDHSDCRKKSFVCEGKLSDNWVKNSTFLPNYFDKISCTGSDEDKLLKCINYRLGQAVLERTKKNRNSQKVEATNRSMRRSLPRNVTFSTAMTGRAHSCLHSVNNGPGVSLVKLCRKVGCPIKSNTRVSRGLAGLQKKAQTSRTYNKSTKAKKHRVIKRAYMYDLYDNRPTTSSKPQYKKSMILEEICDHTYAKQ